MTDIPALAAQLCALAALPNPAPLAVTGSEPVLPSSFRVDAAAAASIGAAALAAEAIWRHRTGAGQGVSIDLRHAAAEFRSERHRLLRHPYILGGMRNIGHMHD